jgi:hypothetical protein
MKDRATVITLVFVMSGALAEISCSKPAQQAQHTTRGTTGSTGTSGQATSPPETSTQPNPDRDAYFGETHLHTSWSVDA